MSAGDDAEAAGGAALVDARARREAMLGAALAALALAAPAVAIAGESGHFVLLSVVLLGGLASAVPITGRVWSTPPESARSGALRGLNVWFAAWGVTYTLGVLTVSLREGWRDGLDAGLEGGVMASVSAWPLGLLFGWLLLLPTAGLALLFGWLLGRRHAHDRAALGEGR